MTHIVKNHESKTNDCVGVLAWKSVLLLLMYVEPFQRSIVTSYSTCDVTFFAGAGGVNVSGMMDAS